jgi:hypothetical protein
MLISSKVEHAVASLARSTDLCPRGKEVLQLWANAVTTSNIADYNTARYSLGEALADHVQRLVIVSPLTSWQEAHLNVLVFSPCYQQYEEVKRQWPQSIPLLPLHFPVELEAGIGPYATGRHLVLFLNNAAPKGKYLSDSPCLSLEFLTTWCARWDSAMDWFNPVLDPLMKDYMQELTESKYRRNHAILESILAHEIGHIDGLWPIFPTPPDFELSAIKSIPIAQQSKFKIISSALADIAADVSHVHAVTDEALFSSVIYHLSNLRYCWSLEDCRPNSIWKPLTRDSDCLAGALIASSVIMAGDKSSPCLSQTYIREGFYNVERTLRKIISDIELGCMETSFNLLDFQIPTHVRNLLDMTLRSANLNFEKRLPMQDKLKLSLLNFLDDLKP